MRWVILFLVVTIGCGALGFGAASPMAVNVGQLAFAFSLIVLLVSLMVWAIKRGGPARPFF